MKLMVMGDMHGNWRAIRTAIEQCKHDNVKLIIQVGDFGIWPGRGGEEFLDIVDAMLERAGIVLRFVDGNHDDHNQLDLLRQEVEPDGYGHYPIRPNVLHIPRGNVWEMDGKTFMGIGGAASIDKDWREPHVSWWPQELITQADIYNAMENSKGKKIDYLFTHDASDQTPWGFTLVPHHLSYINRKVIDWLLDNIEPRFHFHGHMHKLFDWERNGTKVYGLDIEAERNSLGILDTDKDSFQIVPWKMPR